MRSEIQDELDRLEREGCTVRLSAGDLGERSVTSSGEGMASCSIGRDGQTASASRMTREGAALAALDGWRRIAAG